MKREWSKSKNILIQVVCLWAIICCFLVVTIEVYAAQQNDSGVQGESETRDETVQNQPWEPPPPPSDPFDWIQLKSGEWLKGTLKALYEKQLEFDSDELGLLEFDWEDVKLVQSNRILGVRFEGPITTKGMLFITEDKVFVTVGEEKQEYERSELLSIAAGGLKEINYWTIDLNVGLNIASGNTDQTQWSAIANIKRRTSATRLIADFLGNFTATEGEETINNQRLNAYYDLFRTRQYFFRPIFGEYYRDPIKNIRNRVTAGAGMGFHLKDTIKTTWDVSFGPAYQKTRFDSVPDEDHSSESTFAFMAGTHFDTELTKRVDFDFTYNFQVLNEASGGYTHHLITSIETELTEWLNIDISFVWDRIQHPQTDAEDTEPEKDDFYLIFSLGIEF